MCDYVRGTNFRIIITFLIIQYQIAIQKQQKKSKIKSPSKTIVCDICDKPSTTNIFNQVTSQLPDSVCVGMHLLHQQTAKPFTHITAHLINLRLRIVTISDVK